MPAQYWRFNGGLKDAPEPAPPPPCQPIMAGWNCVQNWAQPWIATPVGYRGCRPPPQFVRGPVYFNGIATPPPPYAYVNPLPAYGNLSPPPPPDAEENSTPTPPAEERPKKKKGKKENYYAPPKLPDHCNYMFDREHTILNIFNKTHQVWEDKCKDQPK